MTNKNRLSQFLLAAGIGILAVFLFPTPSGAEPYQVTHIYQASGTGGIDYVYADNEARRLYIPWGNKILVLDLDTFKPTGTIGNSGGHGVAVDPKSHHGFSSSKPLTMFDSLTLETIKAIPVAGRPDGIFYEPATGRIFVLSREAPNVTVIDPNDGSVTGAFDLGGAPAQAASDNQGRVYITLEDQSQIAVVDAKTLKCVAHFSLDGKGGSPAGLGLDAQNHILFAMCRNPATCVILNADDGKILATLPIGIGTDGGGFNPKTMEAFSSQLDGTLTVIKETSPTNFVVAQTLPTKPLAKTCALDTKNNRVILITLEPAPVSSGADVGQAASTGGRHEPHRKFGGPGLLDILVVGN